MRMRPITVATTDWADVPREEKTAEAGPAFWHKQTFGDVRMHVRMVEYTPRHMSAHGCTKGPLFLGPEQTDGHPFTVQPGMSYQVADNAQPPAPRRRTDPRCSSWTEFF